LGNGGTTGSFVGAILDNASLVLNRTDAYSLTNTISGTGALTQAGSGTVYLTANNTLTGGTIVNAGTLAITNGGTLGATNDAITLNAGTIDLGGQTSTKGNFTMASGTLQNGTLAATNYSLTGGGAITATLVDGFAGASALTKSGTGTATLYGNNTYTGGTTVNAGTLAITNGGTMGATNNAVTLNAGTIDLGGQTSTKGNFTMAGGTLQNGTLAATNYSLTGSGTVAANLADGFAGASALTKSGVGTATLSGNNTYTGVTAINAGTLNVVGLLGSSNAVNVNGGILAGNGSVGNVTVASGGTLYPSAVAGTNAAITFTAKSLALNVGSTLDMNITPNANVNDKIATTSLIQISGGTLNLKFSGTFNTGTTTSWTLWTTGASLINDFGAVNAQGALAGSFTQQTQGSWILTGIPGYLDITLNTANGLLTAQAIPEPSTWALLGLSLIMGLVVRRKFLRNKERSL
jgi:autotransporter-associated beta strand protein